MSKPADFAAILAHWEAQQPDAIAITFGGSDRTWAELAHRVRRAAAALRAAGLAPGDRIAVLDLNHPSCLELTLACAQIGSANAVVNFRLAPPEIAYVINDSKARLLFVGPEFAYDPAHARELLKEAGYEVVAIADGADALMEMGRRKFDVLILDINVPTLDGLRLFEIMIQKGIETPAIFITGVAGAEAEARSLEMGAADFLRKPLRKENLLPRIRTILQHAHRSVPAKRHNGD